MVKRALTFTLFSKRFFLFHFIFKNKKQILKASSNKLYLIKKIVLKTNEIIGKREMN